MIAQHTLNKRNERIVRLIAELNSLLDLYSDSIIEIEVDSLPRSKFFKIIYKRLFNWKILQLILLI